MGAKGLWWHTKRHKSCPILWRHYNAKKNLIESIILIRTFKENASTIQDFGAAYQMTSHCKEGTYLWELAVGIQMPRMVNVACSFLIRLGSTNLKEYGISINAVTTMSAREIRFHSNTRNVWAAICSGLALLNSGFRSTRT